MEQIHGIDWGNNRFSIQFKFGDHSKLVKECQNMNMGTGKAANNGHNHITKPGGVCVCGVEWNIHKDILRRRHRRSTSSPSIQMLETFINVSHRTQSTEGQC